MTSVKDVDDILQSSLFDETTTYYCSIWQAKITDFLPENQISTTTDILSYVASSLNPLKILSNKVHVQEIQI